MNNVIVSPHFLSTDIGSKIFKQGGNAVDAAITTNLIQGIVAPETCGIGGDLFAIVWDPEKNSPSFQIEKLSDLLISLFQVLTDILKES